MDLYDFPDLYAALRAPDPQMLADVRRVLVEHLGRPLTSVMDPACGPANWLLPFAQQGVYVAGNDLSERMVRTARRTLKGYRCEIVRGDMRDLKFRSGPFDAAIEIAGTAALLFTRDDLLAHFRSVGRHVRKGGLLLVTLFFRREGDGQTTPQVCYQSGPIRVGARGEARVTYEVTGWSDEPPAIEMLRVVHTRGVPNCPERLDDRYALRVWPETEVRAVIAEASMFTILGMDALSTDDEPDPQGEQTLLLRRA